MEPTLKTGDLTSMDRSLESAGSVIIPTTTAESSSFVFGRPADSRAWSPEDSVSHLIRSVMREDPSREGLVDTPDRVVRAWREMTEGYDQSPADILSTEFESPEYDEMVVVRDMEFWSTCEHHLLPFHGTATVGYVPNGKVVGLSKVARLLHCFARRLQIQERLTVQIADCLSGHLDAKGVGVVLKATHLCMCARGVRTPSVMVTSRLTGMMRDNAMTRAEFFSLANGGAKE